MDLLSHWRHYLKDLPSPDSYIDWGFYSMVASGLQRRVWTSADHSPIYANLYVVLVGPPATGKTMVVKQVKKIHASHFLFKKLLTPEQEAALRENDAKTMEVNDEIAESMKKMVNPPLLYPMAADSTTYESLIQELALSTRTHKYVKTLPDGRTVKEVYFHNSLSCMLSEMSNLFRKKAEDIVKYLLDGYDCEHFRYRTKHQGEDVIQNPCINLLAGTTPTFIQDSFSSALINDGFTSRVHFVFENKPRHYRYGIKDLDASQIESYSVVQKRIGELSKLYGKVSYTPEAWAYLKHFFEEVHRYHKTNDNPKLEDYFGRKVMHTDKLAMAMHFADSNEMTIGVDVVIRALVELEKVEQRMHLALTFGDRNPDSPVAKKILDFIRNNGPRSEGEIIMTFYHESTRGRSGLIEILTTLLSTNQLSRTMDSSHKYCIPASAIVEKKSSSAKTAEMLDKYSPPIPEKPQGTS